MIEQDALPISLVLHTVFCRRRAWLEAAGERVDSVQIEHGTGKHASVDRPRRQASRHEAVEVHSEELGIVGRCDVVERDGDAVTVVEYKSTPVRKQAEVTRAQAVQLALQVMCLQSMGERVSGATVHFTDHQTRVVVDLSEDLLQEARGFVAETRAIVTAKSAPEPLLEDSRCRSCSHASVCLPDEHAGKRPSRQITAADPDAEIVHLTTQGSWVNLRKGRVRVHHSGAEVGSVPIERVAGVVVHGNIDLSSALVRELLWRRGSIVWCSGRGRVVGWANSANSPNGGVRVQQMALSLAGSLQLARGFVSAKIHNQATFLRRNGPSSSVISSLRRIGRQIVAARSVEEVFGKEGEAASLYFSQFTSMIHEGGAGFSEQFSGRTGRGATDPLNCALNFSYGLLLADCIRAVTACGLDPSGGFLHSSSRNKPALALDLMEEFRPLIADSTVIRAINNGELKPSMFTSALGDTRLRESGRKALIRAYEARVGTVVTHPVFGYKVTWRRAMEVQARMVLGVLEGSQTQYLGVKTR